MNSSRIIPLKAAWNFRDCGGYRAAHGCRVRWRMLFRSDSLSNLTDIDLAALNTLGLRFVLDLRNQREASAAVGRYPETVQAVLPFPISDGSGRKGLLREILDGDVRTITVADVSDAYKVLLEEYPDQFGRLLLTLAGDVYPAVVHCASGRDRTGLAAALLLSALGVSEEEVLDDFALTGELWARTHEACLVSVLRRNGMEMTPVRPGFAPPREALSLALSHIKSLYGSVTGYITDRAGVPTSTITDLRARLLVLASESPGREPAESRVRTPQRRSGASVRNHGKILGHGGGPS